MQTMSFKWCSKGCFIEAIEVFLNPYFYLINNKSPNYSGWETHKIQYGLKSHICNVKSQRSRL